MSGHIHRREVLALMVISEAVILYLTASSLASHGALYGCAQFCGTSWQRTVPLMAALFGVATFLLPIVIGACCRTWQGAAVLVAVSWGAAVIGHAGTLLAPAINLASASGPYGGNFGSPLWLDRSHVVTLLLSVILLLILGSLGWMARQTWQASMAPHH